MPIPVHVQQHITHHTAVIAVFNAEVFNLQAFGARLGQPGRYESEYRIAHEPLAHASVARLAYVAQLAAEKGLTLPPVPDLVPWSAEALQWRGNDQ